MKEPAHNIIKMGRGISRVLVSFAAVFLFITLFAQPETITQSRKVPRHDAAAVIKLVTVRVLDQKGRPVMDLNKEDFILYDNGIRKTITEFEVHAICEEGMKVLSSGEETGPAESAIRMNRRILVFFDIQGSDVIGMANAKKAAISFVDTQLRPDDEVGILGFSPTRGFLIQEYLTTDHERIRRAIKKARDIEINPIPGFISGREFEYGVGEGSSESMDLGERSIPVPGSRSLHRGDFVSRIHDLTQTLKYIPGNKSLIIFSDRNLGPHASWLGRHFASADTPVYVVNTRNWIRQGILTLSIKKKHIWTDHPLQNLAHESGGKYFADVKDIERISREIQSLSGNYYVLGYYISEKWDGWHHRIKVEVVDPELQVLAPRGYFNPRPFSKLSDFQKQLHLFDLVFTESHAASRVFEIPIEPLFIPGEAGGNCLFLSRMEVDEKTGIPPSKVEIFVFLFDEDRKVVKEIRREIDFSPFNNQSLISCFPVDLPSGAYECRIVTRDIETGQSSVGKEVFSIPRVVDAEIGLTSPLLFVAGSESPIFWLSKRTSRKGSEQDLTLESIYRYLPANHHLVVREIRPENKNLLAVLPVAFAGDATSGIDFNVKLRPKPDGEAILLSMEILDSRAGHGNQEILIMEMRLPDVAPGEYELEIEAVEKNTSAVSAVRRSLVMR